MHRRFIVAALIVITAVSALIYSASRNEAKAVVTVEQLAEQSRPVFNIRLGARVTDAGVDYRLEPVREVRFSVHGLADPAHEVAVVYNGTLPDTLKAGRDVILDGDFNGKTFVAQHLMTQCPSKYVPPVPAADSSEAGHPAGLPAVEGKAEQLNTRVGETHGD